MRLLCEEPWIWEIIIVYYVIKSLLSIHGGTLKTGYSVFLGIPTSLRPFLGHPYAVVEPH